jgi:hypothetical protein
VTAIEFAKSVEWMEPGREYEVDVPTVTIPLESLRVLISHLTNDGSPNSRLLAAIAAGILIDLAATMEASQETE